jgi:hypothetical protein
MDGVPGLTSIARAGNTEEKIILLWAGIPIRGIIIEIWLNRCGLDALPISYSRNGIWGINSERRRSRRRGGEVKPR